MGIGKIINPYLLAISLSPKEVNFYKKLEVIRTMISRRWDNDNKVWVIPFLKENIEKLKSIEIELSQEILDKIKEKEMPEKEIIIKFPDFLEKNLYQFQKEGVIGLEKFEGCALLADEQGLGKTIQAIAYLAIHPELRPALVVCPNTLKRNWYIELFRWLKGEEDNIQVITSKDKTTGKPQIKIINYDILEKFKDRLIADNYKIIIGDEIHRTKNLKTKRTKAFMEIHKERSSNKLIAMSGTPAINRPVEFFTALKMLRPSLFPNWYRFVTRYCDPKYNGFGYSYAGSSNEEELSNILTSQVMIRRLKKDVLKELPDKTKQIIMLESFGIVESEEYQQAKHEFILWLKDHGKSEKTVNILAQIEVLKQVSFKLKFEQVCDWIDDFLETGKKIVLFCIHHDAIDKLLGRYACAVSLDGRVKESKRIEAVNKFQNDIETKIFIGQLEAAGVGITLTAADSLGFLEFGWSPGVMAQAEDRIHRIGQKNAAMIYYFVAKDTIDEDIIDMLDQKNKVLTKILDGVDVNEKEILGNMIKKYKEM